MLVLHVEDNPVDADLTRRALARHAPDIRVRQATSLAAAQSYLEEAPAFQVALVDLRLPDGSGMDLLTQIRERGLPMAVVMLTGTGDHQAAISALQAGADDYLIKGDAALDRLPAVLRDAWSRFQAASARRAMALRVLYAEHSQTDVDLTRRHLARHAPHIRLTVVPDAEAALARLPTDNRDAPEFDVLLLDYRLPGVDALEAVKTLRVDRQLDLPIVIVSGQGSEEVAARAIHLGVDDYLSKHGSYLFELPATLEKVHRQAALDQERAALRQTTEKLNHVLACSPVILYSLRVTDRGPAHNWISGNLPTLLGYTEEEALTPGWWAARLHPDDREKALTHVSQLAETGQLSHEYRFLDGHGQVRWIHDEVRLTGHTAGEAIGAWRDVTGDKMADLLRQTRMAVLDGLVAQQPLPELLGMIASRLESIRPEMRVSILLQDARDSRLHTGASPSLPAYYNEAVDGLEAREGNGSCGTAAALGEMVIVADIQSHPYWTPYRELAHRAGLAACWSFPFKDQAGLVLGTFAIYYAQTRHPTQVELDLIEEFSRITGLAVRHARADASLRQAAAVLESTREGVVVTDLESRIISVNRAFTEITGYEAKEVLGRNPSLLRSGRQDALFYRDMWTSIHSTSHWQGEVWNRRKNGELYPQLLSVSTVRDREGRPSHYVGVMTDISQLKQSEARLEHLAQYDSLTDLPNRSLVQARLAHALDRAEWQRRLVAVLFIDLDRFKNVNESLGHPVGDALLEMLAMRLRERLRDEDTLGRLGGDEFLVVLEHLERPEDAAGVAQSLIQILERPFSLPTGQHIYISASIGISLFPQDGKTVTELIQHADAAMYEAKERGRSTYRYYTRAMTEAVHERLELEARLHRAMNMREFVLHYQPQVDCLSGRLLGCEALVRWQDPERGLIYPDRFIPLAEETGLITSLGEWVLRTACQQARAWLDSGWTDMTVAVNLSGREFQKTDLAQQVAAILAESRLPPACLKLELTESTLMGQGEQAVGPLLELKALGVRLSVDDFGTGYSSLAYLNRFPIDELKIDRAFVRNLPQDPNDMEIAGAIIALGRNLKLQVLAEGVETQEQLDFLAQQGCHAYQGYLHSQPMTAPAFGLLLEKHWPVPPGATTPGNASDNPVGRGVHSPGAGR